MLANNGTAALCALRLKLQSLCRDLNGLIYRSDFSDKSRESKFVVDIENDVLLLNLAETGSGDYDGVIAGLELREGEAALIIGLRFHHRPFVLVSDDDFGASERGTLTIVDGTRD